MNHFVNTLAIRRWADQITARSTLPHLVRRLVMTTVKSVSKLDFPAHESVQRSGFDGVVVCDEGNAWVPSGRSVWELSVSRRAKRKADEDFKTRTAETAQEVQEESLIVFVTARHFEHKAQWVCEQEKNGHWKGVRLYDADDLEQWLESAPPVAAWFAGQIGSRPDGVDDVAARWEAISRSATRPLLPSVFLAGREQSIQHVREWLGGQPDRLPLECRSPAEVIDFFCAAITAMDDAERTAFEARSIIVENQGSWKVLRDGAAPAVLVVGPSVTLPSEEIARAVSNGHHVLTPVEPDLSFRQSRLELERASQFHLAQALEECGYSPGEAEQYARAAGGSLAILKKRLARFPSSATPEWASSTPNHVITPCLLLGGWDGRNAPDRMAFEKLAGDSYARCESDLQRLATCRDPLLWHAAGKWRLISKDAAWGTFGAIVSPSSFRELESLAVEILADDDPRFSLPENERAYAAIKGHIPKYSATIKKHAPETLALLGALGPALQFASSTDIVAIVDRMVAEVLSPTATWHRWASLGPGLALLAEASPGSFLRAVRNDLDESDPEMAKLFHEEEGPFLGRCNHAGLLWALEGLAWTTQYLGEVSQILMSLAHLAPSGKWGNRPDVSLCEILSDWMPQTTATVDKRIEVLDLLIRQNAEAAWPILLTLLPGAGPTVSSPTHKPYWRDWANSWERGATHEESLSFITATAERVISQAGQDPARWKDVFKHVGQFPYTVRSQFLRAAKSLPLANLHDADRRPLAEELSKQINRHRHFQDTQWSIPAEVLDELDGMLESLKPESCILRNAWLFDPWPDQFFERGGSYEGRQTGLDSARNTAICEILDAKGFSGVEGLLPQVTSPNDVGRALSMATGDHFLTAVVPGRLEGDERQRTFAGGFVWDRFFSDGWPWADKVLALCSTENSKAWLLVMLGFTPDVWRRAEAAGQSVVRLYWVRCRAYNPDLDSEEVELAVETLVAHKRPGSAIELLSTALHNKTTVATETLFAPLEALLSLPGEKSNTEFRDTSEHEIQQIVEMLQSRRDADSRRLLALEWHYLRMLTDHTGHAPRTLYNHLASAPAFFLEVLSYGYRSRLENESEERPEPTEHDRYMAQQAHRLLHGWRRVPGTDATGNVDEIALRKWSSEARRLAEESGRLEVCDSQIGQVFAHAREDDDGTWPCRAVRQVAEEIASDSLGSGMLCGILNSRGMVFRQSGGDQERELARKFKERADRIRFDAPFVAGVLDAVAQSYERDAQSWDESDRWEE